MLKPQSIKLSAILSRCTFAFLALTVTACNSGGGGSSSTINPSSSTSNSLEEYVKNLSYTPNDVASVSSYTGLSNYQTFRLSTATSIASIKWNFYRDETCTTVENTITFNASSGGPVTLPAGGYRNLDLGSYQIANRYPGGVSAEFGNVGSIQLTYVPASGSAVTGQCYGGSSTSDVSAYAGGCTGAGTADLLLAQQQTAGSFECTTTSCSFSCSYNPDTPF